MVEVGKARLLGAADIFIESGLDANSLGQSIRISANTAFHLKMISNRAWGASCSFHKSPTKPQMWLITGGGWVPFYAE